MQVNKRESMYALLVAVAVMIGITIYGSCSADEDYDYYSRQELSTRAEREMGMGNEGNTLTYPTANEILNNSDFLELASILWQKTLANATSEVRYEFGSYVQWDPTDNSFSWVKVIQGKPTYGNDSATITYDPVYNRNDPAHKYICASFHTHTPMTTVSDSLLYRYSGPSPKDRFNAITTGLPGLVCDYSATRVYPNTPKNAAYQIYHYGPERRQ